MPGGRSVGRWIGNVLDALATPLGDMNVGQSSCTSARAIRGAYVDFFQYDYRWERARSANAMLRHVKCSHVVHVRAPNPVRERAVAIEMVLDGWRGALQAAQTLCETCVYIYVQIYTYNIMLCVHYIHLRHCIKLKKHTHAWLWRRHEAITHISFLRSRRAVVAIATGLQWWRWCGIKVAL